MVIFSHGANYNKIVYILILNATRKNGQTTLWLGSSLKSFNGVITSSKLASVKSGSSLNSPNFFAMNCRKHTHKQTNKCKTMRNIVTKAKFFIVFQGVFQSSIAYT